MKHHSHHETPSRSYRFSVVVMKLIEVGISCVGNSFDDNFLTKEWGKFFSNDFSPHGFDHQVFVEQQIYNLHLFVEVIPIIMVRLITSLP